MFINRSIAKIEDLINSVIDWENKIYKEFTSKVLSTFGINYDILKNIFRNSQDKTDTHLSKILSFNYRKYASCSKNVIFN